MKRLEGTFDNAYKNILQFIEDSEIPLVMKTAEGLPHEDGRFFFTLGSPLSPELFWEVEMPGLPLEEVRYTASFGRGMFDFPRIWVGGASWLWHHAIIRKEHTQGHLRHEIREAKKKIERYEQILAELEETDEKEEA